MDTDLFSFVLFSENELHCYFNKNDQLVCTLLCDNDIEKRKHQINNVYFKFVYIYKLLKHLEYGFDHILISLKHWGKINIVERKISLDNVYFEIIKYINNDNERYEEVLSLLKNCESNLCSIRELLFDNFKKLYETGGKEWILKSLGKEIDGDVFKYIENMLQTKDGFKVYDHMLTVYNVMDLI